MKKFFPYLLGGIVLILLAIIITSTGSMSRRKMDERITLKKSDKIPYGTSAANDLMPDLFPGASVRYDRQHPGESDSIERSASNQAIIIVADYLDIESDDLESLSDFVEKGNYVFIISRAVSDAVPSFFNLTYKNDYFSAVSNSDSLKLRLSRPVFQDTVSFSYPGSKYDGSFHTLDLGHTYILGKNAKGEPNFIQFNKGAGSFFIHSAPLAFSNYFILHKNNAKYFQQVFSVLPKNVNVVLWSEYFLEKPPGPHNKEPDWLAALLSYPEFKWGLLLALLTLALYIVLGMRRKQRMIPPFEKPKNDSLDFVKTLGRLYYDRRDHKNLAGKMAAYFLEHIRSRFKIPTHTLDEAFVKTLHFKSGYPEEQTRSIINAIHDIKLERSINDDQLSDFYKQLELFYQNT